MDNAVERLRWLRQRASIGSKADAARAYSIPYEIYKKLEDGSRSLTRDHADAVARYHHVSRGWLMFGEGVPEGELTVPLVGFVGTGQEITLFESINQPNGSVDALITDPEAVALEVRGDAMLPLARNRDVVFIGRQQRELRGLLGFECAVLLQDGRRFFKILERGAKTGVYDLRSHNAEPMRDLEVHSAGALLGVSRQRRPFPHARDDHSRAETQSGRERPAKVAS